jgi:hypothetical protein
MFARNHRIPSLRGPYVLEAARSPAPWIAALAEPAKKVTVPTKLKEAFSGKGLQPWEMLSQRYLQIGLMAKDRTKDQEASPIIPFDGISFAVSEDSVVDLWTVHFAQPVNHCLTAVARTGLFRDAVHHPSSRTRADTERRQDAWIADHLCTQPERPLKMEFDSEHEKLHVQRLVNARNAAAVRSRAANKPKPLPSPDDWQARPDNIYGFFLPTTQSSSSVSASTIQVQKLIFQALMNRFKAAAAIEHKRLGLIQDDSFHEPFQDPGQNQPQPQRSATGSGSSRGPTASTRDRLSRMTPGSSRRPSAVRYQRQAVIASPRSLTKGARHLMRQIAVYCRILGIKHGILFDSGFLILVIFADLPNTRWRGQDTFWVGEEVHLSTMNVRNTPSDVILTTILGFLIEALVVALEKAGQACSVLGLDRLVDEFLAKNPEARNRLVNEVVVEDPATAGPDSDTEMTG